MYVGNDLNYTSLYFNTKSGFRNHYNIFFRNLNTKSENNGNYEDQADYKFLSNFLYEINYPLFKGIEKHKNYLTPKLVFRYSPNETKNTTNHGVIVNYDSVFGVDRLGRSDMVEGGPPSITLGIDYVKKKQTELDVAEYFDAEYFRNEEIKKLIENKLINESIKKIQNNEEIFSWGIATSLRSEENVDLPTKSTLGQKSSDFFGKVDFNPSNSFGFNYNFNLDNNLKKLNYQSITANLITDNIITSFDFANENSFYGNNKYISNYSTYYKDDHAITFDIRKNLYTNRTEYFNLGYNYDNDCLRLYLNFNKEFYASGSIGPTKNIFFGIVVKDITEMHNFPLIKNFNESMRVFGKKHMD
jgi:LPS-assembly protein